jgi:excisionase family DNA binding protein
MQKSTFLRQNRANLELRRGTAMKNKSSRPTVIDSNLQQLSNASVVLVPFRPGQSLSPARLAMKDAVHDFVLTIDELAAYLKVAKSTLYKLAQEGKVPGQKVGRHWRFRRETIDRWLETRSLNTDAPSASGSRNH